MKKNYFLLLFAMSFFAGKSMAQSDVRPCYTDEIRRQQILAHPEILQIEAAYEAQIKEGLKHIDFSKMTERTSTTDSSGYFWYDIPIVVHVIHDYGVEYNTLSDNAIYNDLKNWNIVYAGANSDTSSVIPPFKKWIGIPMIRLHLATLDPKGNPTHGITRHRNYLTYVAGEYAKFDDWDPTSYVNIWAIYTIPAGGGQHAAAYAFQPPGAATNPQGDGILCDYDYMANSPSNSSQVGKTINHEMGHVFNLMHPWGNTNFPQVALGDDDVDDTPPTWGHNPVGCLTTPSSDDNSLYDTMFATNNFKIYTNIHGGDSLVDYPDTTNAQNIMDYTYCARMFTKGQVARMQAALNSTLAGRNNLWSDTNLMHTGILDNAHHFTAFPDLKPIPDFVAWPPSGSTSASNYMDRMNYFTIPGRTILFYNESWNDTITSLTWTFSNGASTPSYTITSGISASGINEKFKTGGWVQMSMTETGNNTGDTTANFNNSVFVASPTATPAPGYMQDFNPTTSPDYGSWPYFNYYNNEFKWQLNDSFGYYDNYSMEYLGYDKRIIPNFGIYPYTGSRPTGDVDDMFSVPFDLTAYSGSCFLNFMSSGASRSSTSVNINDTMEIDYMRLSDTGTGTWTRITKLGGSALFNKGAKATSYSPSSPGDWVANGISIPGAAITPYTVFRFRYLPGASSDGYSASNNFYMDNIHISEWPAAVENVKANNAEVTLMPNPTAGDAYVVISESNSTSAQVVVYDVTGKVVYNTSKQISGNMARIQIPHAAIAVPGVYMVQANTGSQIVTKKLVVY